MSGTGKQPSMVPWVLVATITGIGIVVVIAVLFFSGIIVPGGHLPDFLTTGSAADDVIPLPAGSVAATPSVTVVEPSQVAVPDTGVFVRVDYIGSFTGSYGLNGAMQNVRSSGSRLYPLSDAPGTISVSFQKDDETTRHALTVTVFKDGTAVHSGQTTAAFGNVTFTAVI
jgi:hypothetical protein